MITHPTSRLSAQVHSFRNDSKGMDCEEAVVETKLQGSADILMRFSLRMLHDLKASIL